MAAAPYKGRASVTALPGFEVLAGEVTLEIDPTVQLRTETVIANNPLPNLDPTKLYALTYTHYDDYSYAGKKDPKLPITRPPNCPTRCLLKQGNARRRIRVSPEAW